MALTMEAITKKHTQPSTLNLDNMGLTDADAGVLCSYLTEHPEITKLELSDNQIGNRGAQALAALGSLRDLDLSYNRVGDNGAQYLAANTTLTGLELSHNQLTDVGVRFFENNSNLTFLELAGNNSTIPVATRQKITQDNKALAKNKESSLRNAALSSLFKEPFIRTEKPDQEQEQDSSENKTEPKSH